MTKLLVMWSNLIMLSNEKLLYIWYLDQFTFKIANSLFMIYPVLT